MIGAEAGGAVKNVLAIACGVVEGRGLGRSAHAALVTRGFAEMTRLGVALGGEAETLAGLCGLGDLVLTCSSPQSRNMSVGLALGRGETLQQALGGKLTVAEGVASAPAVATLAQQAGRRDADLRRGGGPARRAHRRRRGHGRAALATAEGRAVRPAPGTVLCRLDELARARGEELRLRTTFRASSCARASAVHG